MTGTDAPLPLPPPAAYGAQPPAPAPARRGTPPGTDGGMVRNEEQLRVGTERVAATRVRLVKYVVTEEVQITVPIRREEIRVEEVPIDAVGRRRRRVTDRGGGQLRSAQRAALEHGRPPAACPTRSSCTPSARS